MMFKKQTKNVFAFGFFFFGGWGWVRNSTTIHSNFCWIVAHNLEQTVKKLALFSWVGKLHHRISYMTQ